MQLCLWSDELSWIIAKFRQEILVIESCCWWWEWWWWYWRCSGDIDGWCWSCPRQPGTWGPGYIIQVNISLRSLHCIMSKSKLNPILISLNVPIFSCSILLHRHCKTLSFDWVWLFYISDKVLFSWFFLVLSEVLPSYQRLS